MDWVFKQQIGRNVKVYVDNMVVKSQSIAQHVPNLEEVFEELHKYDMRINPEKCTYGVGRSKFLYKCALALEMRSPTNVQEVRKLHDRLASLSRFLPKFAEKAKLFYKMLKKT